MLTLTLEKLLRTMLKQPIKVSYTGSATNDRWLPTPRGDSSKNLSRSPDLTQFVILACELLASQPTESDEGLFQWLFSSHQFRQSALRTVATCRWPLRLAWCRVRRRTEATRIHRAQPKLGWMVLVNFCQFSDIERMASTSRLRS